MKKLFYLFILSLITLQLTAQNDTIFIMRHGMIIYQKAVSDVDSILFYRPVFNPHGQILDPRDSTIYNTIIIGNQLWLAENLRYLPAVHSPQDGSLNEGRYYVSNYWGSDVLLAKATCAYEDYGVLYNWSSAQTACPPGWHLPSDAEWNTMFQVLGDTSSIGLKLKQTGYQYWNAPNANVTNESGFSALAGGLRDETTLTYYDLGNYGFWWSATSSSPGNSSVKKLYFNQDGVEHHELPKNQGFSVRCIVD